MGKRVIASVAIGIHENLFKLTSQNLNDFALKYNYEVSVITKSLDLTRPPAWSKILHILELMKSFDEILWIDSDAIIIDSSKDISEDIDKETDLAWVYHQYENQSHPNSGVMYIRTNPATKELFTLANRQEDLTDHPWWDQAALMRIIGQDSHVWPIGLKKNIEPPKIREQRLTAEWNSIRQDPSSRPRIRHFAGEFYWARRLLLAEYANPNEYSKRTLSEMLDFQEFDESVQQQNQQLEQQNQQLEQQNQQLEQQNQQLEQQNQQLEQQNQQLEQRNQQLEQQNQQLEQQYFSIVFSRTWRAFSIYRKLRDRL